MTIGVIKEKKGAIPAFEQEYYKNESCQSNNPYSFQKNNVSSKDENKANISISIANISEQKEKTPPAYYDLSLH